MTDPLRKHHPTATKYRDHRGRRICTCGSVWEASIHDVPERSDEEREIEQRRMGEGREAGNVA